jgi:hypothetical protein
MAALASLGQGYVLSGPQAHWVSPLGLRGQEGGEGASGLVDQ